MTPPALESPPEEIRSELFRSDGKSGHFESRGAPGRREFTALTEHARRTFAERDGAPFADTGSVVFDALYALAIEETRENSVREIRALAFNHGAPIPLEAFETGEMWQYVWTRDLAYAVDLGLASFDRHRCIRSLMYKTSKFKPGVSGDLHPQILEDTGTGGSYPVSTDRVVWALAAARVAHFLEDDERDEWVSSTLPILCNTIEQDRLLVFDHHTGLYRGEQSFLDWREQTYPLWTKENVLGVATSQSLSTNAGHRAILEIAARWLRRAGDEARADRYAEWAESLRDAIRRQLLDEGGLLATYRLFDLHPRGTLARQYDLLGLSLAILTGVLSADEAAVALRQYPTGPFGPPVQWPEDPTVPIYHNHAIWPFVTAYWVRAARHARAARAMHNGIASLVRGAALCLSNMENLDFGSGEVEGHSHGLSGPKINSRRQLWSVAGYLSLVQDAIFGLETHDGGLRFHPVFPVATRRDLFGEQSTIRLRNLSYRGRTIDVTLELPADDGAGELLEPARATLNGEAIDADRFVPADHLRDGANDWRVALRAARSAKDDGLRFVSEFQDFSCHFGPATPAWADDSDGPLAADDGTLVLRGKPNADPRVRYNLIRDGQRVSTNSVEPVWREPIEPGETSREYRIEAYFPETNNYSRLSIARRWFAKAGHTHRLEKHDANAVAVTLPFEAGKSALRVRYTNGHGTIDTGLTCAVRRVRITRGGFVALAYLTMPQTGGWHIEQWSNFATFDLPEAGDYEVSIDCDGDTPRNMSYFEHNLMYTANAGGGDKPTNDANLRAIEVQPL